MIVNLIAKILMRTVAIEISKATSPSHHGQSQGNYPTN